MSVSQVWRKHMEHKRRALLALLAVVAVGSVALSGCGETLVSADSSDLDDRETIEAYSEEAGFFDESDIYDVASIPVAGSDQRTELEPVRIWREITERVVTRVVQVDHVEGTADLSVTRELLGTLNIVDSDSTLYVKPMHHTGVRYAEFEKDDEWEPDNDGGYQAGKTHRYRRGPWGLTATSGLLSSSEHLTMHIDWMRVQSATVDVTISDPTLLMSVPDEIMHFEVGQQVTVTVSGPPDDALVFLHTRRHRDALEYDAGVFTGTWTVMHRGAHCAAIQALAHDSIYDSEYPDDCLIWGMPYAVGTENDVEPTERRP